MKPFRLLAAAIVLSGMASVPALAADLNLSNKWRIECSESAKSDGVIRFSVTPDGGEPVVVEARIRDGRSENGVARDIRDAFKATLDPKRFHAETDDGEDVLVKRRSGSPRFELRLVESTVKAVRLNVGKE
jgi:hypothetical protein